MHRVKQVEKVFHFQSAGAVVKPDWKKSGRCGQFPGNGTCAADALYGGGLSHQIQNSDQEDALEIIIGVEQDRQLHACA